MLESSSRLSQSDSHPVRFGFQTDSKYRSEVWFSSIFRPVELEVAQQGDQDEEELHVHYQFRQTDSELFTVVVIGTRHPPLTAPDRSR